MALPSEKYLIRLTLVFLMITFAFKLEFWPVSYYPVFSSPIKVGEFTSYRFALEYSDGRVVFPLHGGDARRMDVYVQHDFEGSLHPSPVGALNFYAGLSMLRIDYHSRMLALSKLLDNLKGGFILKEEHRLVEGQYRVVKSERLFEQSPQEIYAHIL